MAAGRLRQLQLLLWKNWLFSVSSTSACLSSESNRVSFFQIRSWKSTLLQLLAPFFFLVLVTLLTFLPSGLKDDLNPEVKALGGYPKCKVCVCVCVCVQFF